MIFRALPIVLKASWSTVEIRANPELIKDVQQRKETHCTQLRTVSCLFKHISSRLPIKCRNLFCICVFFIEPFRMLLRLFHNPSNRVLPLLTCGLTNTALIRLVTWRLPCVCLGDMHELNPESRKCGTILSNYRIWHNLPESPFWVIHSQLKLR